MYGITIKSEFTSVARPYCPTINQLMKIGKTYILPKSQSLHVHSTAPHYSSSLLCMYIHTQVALQHSCSYLYMYGVP